MTTELTSLQARVIRENNLSSLEPGSGLPSERELAEGSGAGRAAVRGMLASLRREGIVERSSRGWILLGRIPEVPAVDDGSKRQRAKNFLLSELGSGRLRPGDQLSELAFAKQCGVSTVSMREAFLEIQPLGLITKKERQQWVFATFSDDRIREMREFREMVEIFSLRKILSVGLSAEQRSAFEANEAETKRIFGQQRPAIPTLLQVDLDFHRLLIESAGNSLIKERAGFIYLIVEFQLISPFYSVEQGNLGLSQHLRILEAVLCEDLATAERALCEHLQSAAQFIATIVQKSKI